MKSRIEVLEMENSKIKEDMEHLLKYANDNTEKAILTTTETVLQKIKFNQYLIEHQTNLRFNSLEAQITSFMNTVASKTPSNGSASKRKFAILPALLLNIYLPTSSYCHLWSLTSATIVINLLGQC